MDNFSYEYFVECLNLGDSRDFWYKDQILIIRSGLKKSLISNKEISTFTIEHKGKVILRQEYKTPKELLEKVRVGGKSLKEIWNELTFA